MSETPGLYIVKVGADGPRLAPPPDLAPVLLESLVQEQAAQIVALKSSIHRLVDVFYSMQSRVNALEARETRRRYLFTALAEG